MKVAHSGILLSTFIAFVVVDACKRPQKPSVTTTSCKGPLGPTLPTPTSVNKLRPADIGIIGSIGDSDSAAYATRGNFLNEDRDLSFITGANNKDSLASILRQYEAGLEGMSLASNNVILGPSKPDLNVAVSGAVMADAAGQANILVEKVKKIDGWQEKWKIISIQMGGNDLCMDSCDAKKDASAKGFRSSLEAAVDILKENLPRTLVLVTVPWDVTQFMDITGKSWFCNFIHNEGCGCLFKAENKDEARSTVSKLKEEYKSQIEMISEKAKYNSEDFTVEVILTYQGVYPKAEKDGKLQPDLKMMAPDCMHFTPILHSAIGTGVWNNLVEPAGQRTIFTVGDEPKCLPEDRPYISTKKNSA